MPTISRRALLAALLVLASCGCSPYPTLENPLVDPAQAKPLAEWHGLYRAMETRNDGDELYVHIGPASDDEPAGLLRILMVSHSADARSPLDATPMVGFVEPVGSFHVLHLPVPKEQGPKRERRLWDGKWDAQQVEGYLVLRMALTADGFELNFFNEDFVAEQIKGKKLSGRIDEKVVERDGVKSIERRDITITADTDELRAYFDEHIDGKLFDDRAWKFVRVGGKK